MMMMMKRQ